MVFAMNWPEGLKATFLSLPERESKAILKEVKKASKEKDLTYEREGKVDIINLLPLPLVVTTHQVRYLHRTCLLVKEALSSLIDLYIKQPSIREIIPLQGEEVSWVYETWTEAHKRANGVWSRLDLYFDIYSPRWKDTITFFEENSVAVGGNHYVPAAEEIITTVVLPRLRRINKDIILHRNEDIRILLLEELIHQAKAIGRHTLHIAFAEDKTLTSGITEFPTLVDFYNTQYGRRFNIKAFLVDPREFYIKGDEIYYKGNLIDIIYRDFELLDLFKMGKGRHLEAIKGAFRNNQVVSTLAGEFDHKGCWEVLTAKRFPVLQRAGVLNHIPWTRVIREVRTLNPKGKGVNLLNYIRKDKDSLVLKPNRGYGGYGIAIGKDTPASQWDDMMDRAVKEKGGWVAQEYKELSTKANAILDENGEVSFEEFYTVYGLAGTREGLGILGRASQQKIVNVAQRGGIVAVLRA